MRGQPTRIVAAAFVVLLSHSSIVVAADLVTVETVQGHHFEARIDSRTDTSTLWLRFGEATAYILQPVPWNQVVSATQNGKDYSSDEFRRSLRLSVGGIGSDRMSRGAQSSAVDPSDPTLTSDDEAVDSDALVQTDPRTATVSVALPDGPRSGRIQFLEVDAYATSWDGDVEPDGLIMRLRPIGFDGSVLPVSGTVDIRLIIAPRGRRDFAQSHHLRADALQTGGKWTKRLAYDDVTSSGAMFKLPYPAFQPNFKINTADFGLIHARLVVAGQGVFEVSRDAIPLRYYTPIRDASERSTGRRFLPFERINR